jgi:glycosyltransferase involved in cell wall biosynthesis
MSKNPKVSVIIPTHNRAELLRGAIASVMKQTFQDFEVIVVDDASKDNTPEVVHSFADNRIRYVRNEINKGEGGSRNVGLRNASGDFIAFLDDDDEWLPEKLRLQVDLLERSPAKVGAVYTGFYQIEKSTGRRWQQPSPTKRGDVFRELLTENWIVPSTMLLRKQCFDTAGWFEEGMNFGTDYDMWLRVAKEFHFEYIDRRLVYYHLHGQNVTANHDMVIHGLESQLRKYAELWESNRKGYSRRYLSLGVLYCRRGQTHTGRSALVKAIRIYPFEIRNYLNLLLSLFGATVFRKICGVKESLIFRIRERRFS